MAQEGGGSAGHQRREQARVRYEVDVADGIDAGVEAM